MRESTWSADLCKGMRLYGADVFRIVGHVRQESNRPDSIIFWKDLRCYVEFKGLKTTLGVGQKIKIARINVASHKGAYVLRLLPGSLIRISSIDSLTLREITIRVVKSEAYEVLTALRVIIKESK